MRCTSTWRKKRHLAFVIRAVFLTSAVSVVLVIQTYKSDTKGDQTNDITFIKDSQSPERDPAFDYIRNDRYRLFLSSRKLLNIPEVYKTAPNSSEGDPAIKINFLPVDAPESNETEEEQEKHVYVCTEPAFLEFPPDLFTQSERREGAMVLHIIMVIYMFIALAVVCDLYFVSSLEKICEKLNLSEDVAGATFMAAGSSAPELFTSVIGLFVAKGDVGVGTIVGSAVFNILFVVGICGLLVSQFVSLTWFPLIRDSIFYSISVVLLIWSISDSRVQWYESLLMLICYTLYIVVMKFNVPIHEWAVARVKIFGEQAEDLENILPPGAKVRYYSSGDYEPFHNEKEQSKQNGHKEQLEMKRKAQTLAVDEYLVRTRTKLSFEDACFRLMKSRRFRPITRFRTAAFIIVFERRKMLKDPKYKNRPPSKTLSCDSDMSFTKGVLNGDAFEGTEPDLGDEWKKIPSMSEGLLPLLKWITLTPINFCLYYTVPDCSKKRWDRWFMVTFGMSIVWIAVFSYLMVWMVAVLGYTLGIPDSIMGITFLAAGTSVPDAMASVMVARQGQGDMAVSNTLGSNVFDICIGLALPWFIKTAIISPGKTAHINSNGMVFSVILLFLTVIIAVTSIHFGGWRLDKKLGIICLISYAVFLVFSCSIEFNVFGYVNPPMCHVD